MIGTTLLTWLKGNCIATDTSGNKYYIERFYFGTPNNRKPRRWVIYNGINEASKVPAEWHAWLHFTTDTTPDASPPITHDWVKPHMPNMTGTRQAYEPVMNRAAKHYQSWKPGK